MSIENQIRKFIEDHFILGTENPLGEEDSLLENGIIDSTGVLELVAFIEETYCCKVSDEELIPENLDSIKNISKYIQSKLNFSQGTVNQQGAMN